MPNTIKNIKYVPTLLTSLILLALLGIVLLFFFARNTESLRLDSILRVMPDFYTHISNFSISFILYATIGYFWLMMGVKFRTILLLGAIVVGINFIFELWIKVLNTPDIVDAYFGLWGAILGCAFLFLTYEFGLKPNPLLEP